MHKINVCIYIVLTSCQIYVYIQCMCRPVGRYLEVVQLIFSVNSYTCSYNCMQSTQSNMQSMGLLGGLEACPPGNFLKIGTLRLFTCTNQHQSLLIIVLPLQPQLTIDSYNFIANLLYCLEISINYYSYSVCTQCILNMCG